MKTTTRILMSSLLATAMLLPTTAWAQRRSSGSSTQRAQATARPSSPQRSTATAQTRSNITSRTPQVKPATSATRSGSTQTVRPGTTSTVKPSTPSSTTKPSTTQVRPATTTRPSTPSTRPSTPTTKPSTPTTRPSTNTRPSDNGVRPGGNNGNQPGGNNGVRPGGNPDNQPGGNNGVRPGGNNGNQPGGNSGVRPGGNPGSQPGGNNGVRPGGNSSNRPGMTGHPGSSAQRPGSYRPSVVRPNNHYLQPNYRPPRPGGGYWGPPVVNTYRPVFYLPPRPPRPVYVNYSVPSIGTILGLTFGTFIDASLNTLFNAGYNILGYANNAVYLGNVHQLGFLWPEATVYYSDGLMSDTQFYYWTPRPDVLRFNSVYNSLVSIYGAPVSSNTINGVTTVSWWGGNNTGFITLSYGPGNSATGLANYYTTLTYSDYY